MGDLVETRQRELKKKLLCRFCLSQDDSELSNIYSREGKMIKSAPLPLQVMACASIEVFSNDCMPNFVCNECRAIFDYCYRFKQMCKKADTFLRHYPITGIWFTSMEKPKIPSELIRKQGEISSPNDQSIKCVTPVTDKDDIESENYETMWTMVDNVHPLQSQEELPQKELQEELESEPEPEVQEKPKIHPKPTPRRKLPNEKPSQKLLNKSAIRILNKEAQHINEPRMSKPVLKLDNDGNMAVVTEILDPNDVIAAPDPVENTAVVETNVFPCPHCERSFPLRQLLDIHMVNHNRERSFNCSDCDKSFFSKYDLQKHRLVHTGEKPFKCVVCEKGFTRSTLLHRHEKTHTDIPKFICIFCEKAFISQEEMEKHTERHRKNRPFTCKICNKAFAFKQGLERHEVVHSRFQPFQCQYCDQSFPTPSKLSRHLTRHAGARPYPCKLCPKAYLLSHHLTRHMRSHKNGTGSYKCNDCDKSFSSRDDLIYHSAVHATQTLVCPLCKDAFEDIETVTEHIKQHAEGEAFACEFCDLIFMTADRLQEHTDADHVDEMEAYNDDEKVNADNQNDTKNITLNENANREIDEVIEEYLIEEFSDTGPDGSRANTNSSSIIVKKEIEWQTDTNDIVQATESNKYDSFEEEEVNSVGEESIDYMNIIEISENMETPVKLSKVSETDQRVTKKAFAEPELLPRKSAKPTTSLHSNSPSPKENMKPLKKISPTIKIGMSPAASTTPKTRQTTIQDALQGLPRSVSVKKVPVATKPPQTESKSKQSNKPGAPSPVLSKPSTAVAAAKKQTPKVTITSESASAIKQTSQVVTRPLRQRSETSPNTTPQIKASTSSSSSKEIKKPFSKPMLVPMKNVSGSSAAVGERKVVEMMIGNKRVKVHRITMSKAEAAAMARDGRIQMKEGTMILKKDPNQALKVAKKSS